MSVSLYFGATGKGKSYHVRHHVIPKWKKIVIFDPMESFDGDSILHAPSDELILKTFRKFKGADSFRIVIRTTRASNDEIIFNKTVRLASSLGRMIPGKVSEENRVQVVIDEASTSGFMSAHYFPPVVKNLVCKGRHDNLDSHFIAQNPMAVHSQLREQTTKIVTFYLNNGRAPIFQDTFTKNFANLIPKLPNFFRIEWTHEGHVYIYDDSGNKIEINSEKFRKIFDKKGIF